MYNSFECDDFVDNFKHDTYFSFKIVVIWENIDRVSFIVQMLHYNWFDSFHYFSSHTSNCKQRLLFFFFEIKDELNVQL